MTSCTTCRRHTHRLPALYVMILALTASLPSALAQGIDTKTILQVTLPGGFTPDPFSLTVTPGGDSDASSVDIECVGYINATHPDVQLDYASYGGPLLVILVQSYLDTTLVVRDPAGNFHCNDDSTLAGGSNPALQITTPGNGTYDVWVGSYEAGMQATDSAVLSLSEIDSSFWLSSEPVVTGVDADFARDGFFDDGAYDEETIVDDAYSDDGAGMTAAAAILTGVSTALQTWIDLNAGTAEPSAVIGDGYVTGTDGDFTDYSTEEPEAYDTLPDYPLEETGQPLPGSSIGGDAGTGGDDYGERSRIIAGDGRSAMHCTSLADISRGDSNLTGNDGRVISNNCGESIEITWCYVDDGSCARGYGGGTWTLGAGGSWPVSVEKEVRYAACIGANTVHWEKGAEGYRFYCTAP